MTHINARWDEQEVRAAFPALAIRDAGVPRIYLDAPGGTQVAGRALSRMREAMVDHCANEGGSFRTSRLTDEGLEAAHAAAAEFVGAAPDEVLYGLNTTSLLFHFSRMLSRDWRPGDDIVLTRMDHDANVAPWLIAAEERGVNVRWLDFDVDTFQYRYDRLAALVGPRTRLVACNHASNFLGTINDVRRIVAAGRAVGAVTVVDAVQSAPHFLLDVAAIGCDLLASSPYKYFGPHAGLLYVRRELADRLTPLKVRPSPNSMPHKHAPGTPSFEAQLGTLGALEHLAWLGDRFGAVAPGSGLRVRIAGGLAAATAHETALAVRFLEGLRGIPGARLYGLSDPAAVTGRVPTFSLRIGRVPPTALAEALAARNIFVWAGSFYAYEIAGALGVRDDGVLRIGFAHYNTLAEVDTVLTALRELARGD
ncbi:MAG: cysteine desulfurase-like protein [Proteobacteria bacterium]|nr:cysteine desulfurase-like protein [Pseudomonadota bacterium]